MQWVQQPERDTLTEQNHRWFAVHTRHQYEQIVATTLSSWGLEVFLPTYETVHRWTDRNKRITLPLFPGYLFFANEIERRVQILSTPGVHTILKAGKVPAVVPNEEIAAVRRMVESTLRVEPHPFLNEGDRVRIKAGPLAGLEGIVSRKKDSVRLIVSIEMLGRSAAVEISGCSVEPVDTRPRARFQTLPDAGRDFSARPLRRAEQVPAPFERFRLS
jgi:transcription antitermination factor NusG